MGQVRDPTRTLASSAHARLISRLIRVSVLSMSGRVAISSDGSLTVHPSLDSLSGWFKQRQLSVAAMFQASDQVRWAPSQHSRISSATHTSAEDASCAFGGSFSLVCRPVDRSDAVLHAALIVISIAVLQLRPHHTASGNAWTSRVGRAAR